MQPNQPITTVPAAPVVPQGSEPAQNIGRIKRGWLLTQSAWHVFKLDKELTALPVLGFFASVVAIVPFVTAFILLGGVGTNDESMNPAQWVLFVALYMLLTFIGNFFAGAVISGAMTRFQGGDPTVKSSMAAVKQRLKPLALYSLMMGTVGLILQIIEDRVPLGGKIATWIVGATWNIANFFALPIIVLSPKTDVAPLTATKQSIGMVKQVWGESVVANVSISIISVLVMIGYMLIGSILTFAAGATLGVVGAIVVGSLLGLGLIAIALVTSVLSGIVKAALFHYATTGKAPETFNQELMRTAMTSKKARKMFA